jgi:hypothetical protein
MRTHLTASILLSFLLATGPVIVHAQQAVRNGEITAITAATKSLTVKTVRGETNIITTDKTVVKEGDEPLTFDDLEVGDTVRVTGVRRGEDVEAEEIVRETSRESGSGSA